MRIRLGTLVVTPGASDIGYRRLTECLDRHVAGDWGIVAEEDKRLNDQSVVDGTRILSAYRIDPDIEQRDGNTLWIITEADRCVTTLLLPEEY